MKPSNSSHNHLQQNVGSLINNQNSVPNASPLTASSYDEFKSALTGSGCDLCASLKAGRHSIVVDRGNSKSAILLVGEAPGEKEDLTGRAFVGRAGKLLDEVMAAIGLDTNQDTLIVNVVKCRPPENRAPTQDEAARCRPFLEWQIAHTKPKVMVLLGATAARHFFPPEQIKTMKSVVGQFLKSPRYPDVTFQILYHPAYILRDPRKKKIMLEHLEQLSALLLVKCLHPDPKRQRDLLEVPS